MNSAKGNFGALGSSNGSSSPWGRFKASRVARRAKYTVEIWSTAVHTVQSDMGGCWFESLLGHRLSCLKVFVDFRQSLQVSAVILNSKFVPYLFIYSLTPYSRVLLEKLTGSQLVKKFPAFHGTRRFISAFTSACHLSLP